MGKIKRKEGEVFKFSDHRNYIKVKEKIISYAVYVAQNNPSICGKWTEGREVHHLNGNSLDDRPENLIVLTKEDHHKIHSKPIDVFFKGEEGIIYIGRYPSGRKAGEELNIPPAAISYYCKNKKPCSKTWDNWIFSCVVSNN